MLDYLYSALANPTVAPDLDWNPSTTFHSKKRNQSHKLKVNKETISNRRSYGSIGHNIRHHVTARKYASLVNELDAIAEEDDEDGSDDDPDPMMVEYVAEKLHAKILTKTSSPPWKKLDNNNRLLEDEPLIMGHSSKKFFSSKNVKSAGKRIRKALRKSISYLAMGLANMTTFVLVPTNIPSPMYHCREFNPYY